MNAASWERAKVGLTGRPEGGKPLTSVDAEKSSGSAEGSGKDGKNGERGVSQSGPKKKA